MLDQILVEKALLVLAQKPNLLLYPITLPLPLKAIIPTVYKGVFWKTICSVDQYKLEKNTITQHYRLLDKMSIIRAEGTEKDMEKLFGQIISISSES